MENRVDILNELQTLSPMLAALDKVNVFTVPQGYFSSIAATVLACINEEENNLSASIGEQNLYGVPQGYFNTLAGSILNKIKQEEGIYEELKIVSPAIAAISKENIFEVPQGYFNALPVSILNKINQAESVQEELKIISPAIAAISKENIFEVPQGYFKNLQQNILQTIQPAAKVVYMQRRSSLLKYAAAAMVTGALALGVYKYSDKAIVGTQVALVENVKPVAAITLDPSIEKGKSMDDKQFTESLNNLSEEEITQYLEKNGDEADVAALASNVEGTSLPSQDDYLLNEKTLENYLKDIETNKQNN